MKKTLLILFVFVTGSLSAQDFTKEYADMLKGGLKVDKLAAVDELLKLNPDQKAAFMPIYNDLQNKLMENGAKKLQWLGDAMGGTVDMKNIDAVSKSIASMTKLDAERVKIMASGFKSLSKVLPPDKLMNLFQMETKINNIIGAEMAKKIPLLGGM